MSASDIDTLKRDVSRLKRANRRWKRLTFGVTTVLTLIFGVGWMAMYLVMSAARIEAQAANRQSRFDWERAERLENEAVEDLLRARLLQDKDLTPLRKELLEAALRYYQEFLKQKKATGPTPWLERSQAYERIGDIYKELGQKDKADEAYRKAKELK